MKVKFLLLSVSFALLVIGCASQRTRVSCAEIEYRLNSMSYSPDQRAFLEEELRQCRAEQAEQEKDDVITNKIKGSIRDRFAADSVAKAEAAKSVEPEPVAIQNAASEAEEPLASEESGGN